MAKTAIITGASRGIGFAIARKLGQEGYQVVLFATKDESACADNFEKLRQDGTPYLYVQGNLGVQADRVRLVEQAVAHFGSVDALVNNAGIAPRNRTDLLEMSEESFDEVVGINTKGNLFLTQLVAKQMMTQAIKQGRRGVIVNVSSCSAEVSSINRGEYCVSKAGVAMLTKLFADRLASEAILVHEVRPGIIATDMTSGVQEKYDALLAQGVFPIARWGTPDDVANAVGVFCGEHFQYTTGDCINVDGGFHIRRL